MRRLVVQTHLWWALHTVWSQLLHTALEAWLAPKLHGKHSSQNAIVVDEAVPNG